MLDSLHIVCPRCLAVNRVPLEKMGKEPHCGTCKQAMFDGQPAELDSAGLEKHVSRNDVPVLVDFWAPWCAPCRGMAPAYAHAAGQLEPNVRVVKVNTEAAPGLAAAYAIRSIPTLILFHHRREVARHSGAMDSAQIVAWAQSHP